MTLENGHQHKDLYMTEPKEKEEKKEEGEGGGKEELTKEEYLKVLDHAINPPKEKDEKED